MLLPDETYDEHEKSANTKFKLRVKKKLPRNFHVESIKTTILEVDENEDEGENDGIEEGRIEGEPKRENFAPAKASPGREDSSSSSGSDALNANRSYERTANFFNNIPDFVGETFPPFLFRRQRSDGQSDEDDEYDSDSERASHANSTDVLRICEDFLWRHRIRPDFFCQYHKAISSASHAPRQSNSATEPTPKSKSGKRPSLSDSPLAPTPNASPDTPAVTEKNIALSTPQEPSSVIEHFAKLSAIYTLPVAKRKKACTNPAADDVADASSSNEAVHLQQRLKSLSTELVTLRNRLHVGQGQGAGANGGSATATATATATSTAPATATTTGTIPPPHLGPTATGLNLNASTPNLHNNSSNNNNNVNNNNNNNNSNCFIGNSQQQQQQQQQQQHHASIISSLNNNNSHDNSHGINNINTINSHQNSINVASKNINNTNNHRTNHAIANSRSSNIFSHTLPHNVSLSGSGVVSSRNTSIPHPLPHQITEKNCVNGNALNGYIDSGAPIMPTPMPHTVSTLPKRSTPANHSSAHNHNTSGHRLPGAGLATSKHSNPCNRVNTLPFGFSSANAHAHAHATGLSNVSRFGYSNCPNDAIVPYKCKETHELEDLIHLPGPLTEDALMRTLQARFKESCYFTNVGPILLSLNPYLDVGNPLTLSSTRSLPLAPQLHKIVQEAVRQQAETGYPQAIILSGQSGAGKTHCSMLLLRQLFAIAGGGPETDAFKHLAAAFTVLRSLGSAKTTTNSESSRIGQFIEVQVTDGALYRTKIHCYFLDQTRVIRALPKEKNYHIFYQMLAGLSREERIKLNLEGYSPENLRYLQSGDISQNEKEDAARFQAWKTCLGILGIPFLDVVRVLAAVLLLGNVQFIDSKTGLEVDVKGETELNSVASLLGVPPAALFRGLTTRTHNARGQLVKSVCDANMSNMTRDCLAKALYCRTVATIVRRANSLKRLGSTVGTLSSDSNESVHNQADVASQHASTVGGNSGSKSMAALNNAVRHATDGFIGILDMFGFEEPSPHAQLEHLCINLCAETMQHFYNTHIFKSSVESCRDEGIACDTEVDYVDNVPCIDLISSLRTGLLSMLDAECVARGTAESYVAKIRVQHRNSSRLETKPASDPHDPRMFTIRHFAGRVEYDATDFLDTNRDVVPDDLVAVFYKHSCNFGFATHLFGSELKALYALQSVPRGLSFRISPTSHSDLLNGDEPVSTLTQDFHTRLDNLLRTLVHARPHFVRCLRSNSNENAGCFDRLSLRKQIRALQVLETVNLMASGFPHRMRFKQFNARYRMLAPFRLLRRTEDKSMDDCNLILDYALENPPEADGSVTLAWAPGKRHVFLSEGIRQHLEHLRTEIRNKSATLIQTTWRNWRKNGGGVKRSTRPGVANATGGVGSVLVVPPTKLPKTNGGCSNVGNGNGNAPLGSALNGVPRLSAKTTNLSGSGATNANVTRPRPQPIAGTPPPDPNEKCDSKLIQQTCSLFGLDLERPPPVPLSRNYTVLGNTKLGYPQSRIMKMNFPEDVITNSSTANNEQLKKGETVTVVGASTCRGHLIVEHKGQSYHVPFQYMELLVRGAVAAAVAAASVAGAGNERTNTNNCNNSANNANSSNVVGSTTTNNNNNNNNNNANNNKTCNNNATTSAAVKI